MWRRYGEAGSGAAIVFDSAQIDARDDTPLIIAQVNYGSEQDRQGWLNTAAEQVARIIETEAIEDRWVHVISFAVFGRLKLFALFSKHDGSQEEREWRVVYLSDRDSAHKLQAMQHYLTGAHGVEPKLRFKIEPIPGVTAPDFSLSKGAQCPAELECGAATSSVADSRR